MSETRPRRPYMLWGALMLNLVLVGLIAGLVLGERGGPPAPPPPGPELRMARTAIAEASPEARQAIRRAFVATLREARQARLAHRNAQIALVETLRAEPFDRAALEAAFEDLRQTRMELDRALQTALVEQMSRLEPDQRAALARAIGQGDSRQRFRRPPQDP